MTTRTPTTAQEAADEHSQLYYWDAEGNRKSAGPNPIKAESFLAGSAWQREQSAKDLQEAFCAGWNCVAASPDIAFDGAERHRKFLVFLDRIQKANHDKD